MPELFVFVAEFDPAADMEEMGEETGATPPGAVQMSVGDNVNELPGVGGEGELVFRPADNDVGEKEAEVELITFELV